MSQFARMNLKRWQPVALLSLMAALIGGGTVVAQNQITLAWDASPGSTIAGYRLYEGPASRTYNITLDVGNTNVATASNLVAGVSYFFAVTAYDIIGLESTFSDEVTYTAPTNSLPALALQILPNQQLLLLGSGVPGYTYEILTSADLQNWNSIGFMVADPTGLLDFIVPDISNTPVAFTGCDNFFRKTASHGRAIGARGRGFCGCSLSV